ncbi:MAG: DUF748 domain-containing protein [Planctomycetota bacterium]
MSAASKPLRTSRWPAPFRERRWLRVLAWIALVLLLLRALLSLAAPIVIARAAEAQGLRASYDELDVSLLGGSLELWNLTLLPLAEETASAPPSSPIRHPPTALLHLESVTLDVDMTALLFFELLVRRAVIDGLDVQLERGEDGQWSLGGELPFAAAAAAGQAKAVAEATPAPRSKPYEDALKLTLPLELTSLRLQHLRVVAIDRLSSPPRETRLDVDLRLSNLGHGSLPGRLSVKAHAPGLLDALTIDGSLVADAGQRLQAEVDLRLIGLHGPQLAPWLAPLGIVPRAGRLDAELGLTAQLERADAQVDGAVQARGRGALLLHGLSLRADGEEQFALDSLAVRLDPLGDSALRLPSVEISGLRARAARQADGTLLVAGCELRSLPAESLAPAAVPVAPRPAAAPTAAERTLPDDAPPTPSPIFVLERLQLGPASVHFEDRSVRPTGTLELQLHELLVENIVDDPARRDESARLSLRLAVPGVCSSVQLLGSAQLFGAQRGLELTLSADGLAPVALEPWLATAGLESDLSQGSFGLSLSARTETDARGAITGEVSLRDVLLRDGERTLFALPELSLGGLNLDSLAQLTQLGLITVRGLNVPLRRDAHGLLHVAGLRTRPGGAIPSLASTATAAAPVATPAAAPVAASARLELGQLAVTETRLAFRDESLAEPAELVFDDLGLTLDGLALGGPTGSPDSVAQLALWLLAPGLTDRLALTGSITSRSGPLNLAVQLGLRGEGLSLRRLEPWRAPAGISSRLVGGTLAADVSSRLAARDEGLSASFALSNLSLQGDGEEWLALERFAVQGAVLGGARTQIESVEIVGPRVLVSRDAEGALQALGLRLGAPAGSGEVAVVETQPAPTIPTPPLTAPPPPADPLAALLAGIPPLDLGDVQWSGAEIRWRDAAVQPAVDLAVQPEFHFTGLALNSWPATNGVRAAGSGNAASARGVAAMLFSLRLPGVLEAGLLTGKIRSTPEEFGVSGTLAFSGLQTGPLASYLPPGAGLEFGQGGLHAAWGVRVARVPEGGHSFEATLTDLSLVSAPAGRPERPVFLLPRVRLAAQRVDPGAYRYDFDEVALQGLQLDALRTADGALHVLGLRLPPAASPAEGASTAAASSASTSASATAPAAPRAVAAPDEEWPAEWARPPLPLITLQSFDVELERLTLTDESAGEGAAPLSASLWLRAPQPLRLLDAQPDELPPLELRLNAGVAPVLRDLDLRLLLSPWAARPEASLELLASGLRGAGLTELRPALAATLDGSGLRDGRLSAALHAELSLLRRRPTDFDLSNGFGLSLELGEVSFRDGEQGERLAGLGGLTLEAPRLQPASGALVVDSVELRTPFFRAHKTAEGLHALGLRLLPPPEPAPGEPAAQGGEAKTSAATATAAASSAPASAPGLALAIDTLAVRGLDVLYRDDSATPPLIAPLTALDVEVLGFDTRAFTERRELRLALSLGAGPVPLPRRVQASSLLAGLASAAGAAVLGDEHEGVIEQRPLFDEVALNARLAFYPALSGHAQLSLNALELLGVAGPAQAAGLIIGDGMLDTTVRTRFRDDGSLGVETSVVFSDLALSEPAGGLIEQYLRLPAPLDSVLFLLRNADGEHRIPVSFSVGQDGLSTLELTRAGSAALGRVLAGAIANAPLRVVGTFTDLVPLGGAEPTLAEQAVALGFSPGSAAVRGDIETQLAQLIELLDDDDDLAVVLEHRFAPADLVRAEELANPSEGVCLQLVTRLRQRRAELQLERDLYSSEARALFAIDRQSDGRRRAEDVSALDAEIGRTEAALDSVLELLRPGAERYREKRTRSAALALGRERLATLRTALLASGVDEIAERIEERAPRLEQVTSPAELDGEPGPTPAGYVLATPKRR